MQLARIRFFSVLLIILVTISDSFSQKPDYHYENGGNKANHKVKKFNKIDFTGKPVKNIILMIGDGMGPSQVYAGLIANKGSLNLENFPYAGFVKTHSADELITDSAAGGTAMATGEKTNNGMVSVDPTNRPLKTILEIAEKNGKSTGLVATSTITHATPASFIAHVYSRNDYERIASEFLKTDVDVFIGGGRDHFTKRFDQQDLTLELVENGYTVIDSLSELKASSSDKIAGLIYADSPPSILDGRGEMLSIATAKAIEVLSRNNEGFFLMVEGSQIDWGNHQNNIDYQTTEMLDFDKVIGEVLTFASENGETLVIVTADHETGGLTVVGGDMDKGQVEAAYASMGHTPTMVPIFTYGPHAESFSGIIDNTEIFDKMIEAFENKFVTMTE